MKFWTLDEFKTAIAHVTKPGFRVALMVLYWAGLRVGECLAITPADVLPSKAIRIEKTHHRKEGEDAPGPPKTENSVRDVSIPGFLYDELLAYINALYDIGVGDRVFYFSRNAEPGA